MAHSAHGAAAAGSSAGTAAFSVFALADFTDHNGDKHRRNNSGNNDGWPVHEYASFADGTIPFLFVFSQTFFIGVIPEQENQQENKDCQSNSGPHGEHVGGEENT